MSDAVKKWMADRREHRFPNTVAIAHFSPHTQMVTLDQYEKDDLPKALEAADHAKVVEIMATISHEMAHWADIVGTIWGRAYLKRIYQEFRLLPTKDRPPRESDFASFIDLHDETRRLTFPKYYQTVFESKETHSARHPWQISISAGQEIDAYGRLDPSRPILFVCFHDNRTGDRLIRQPMTVGALLETIAVASEYDTIRAILMGKVPAGKQKEVGEGIHGGLLSRLYEPSLTLYSAPVHLLAHFAQISDAALAYDLAATIAHVCLNLCERQFRDILLPDRMAPWSAIFPSFKERENRAFAFAVICSNLSHWRDGNDKDTWIDAALKQSGLPGRRSILERALEAIAMQEPGGRGTYLDEAENYMLELGLGVAIGRQKGPTFGPVQAHSYVGVIPPMFDSNGDIYSLPDSRFDFARFDPETMIRLDESLYEYTRNLLTGCR
ncbi:MULTISPECIES: hypothetical protein [unclassified Sinorhizobium]|uniref:hypothetical protein n=1 Tax=unclassified Sinorhizobium TaxID=2613772 RepID=UPI0024C34E80|nr:MULTISPECIES: hypothetical protein [unclassified Sinorhizobium]MDK1376758.1 hypothetical protein [Sinorhizobium sp. 6-70]MDK1479530.1 hypothetical protein [Sinorhizobium sp. 6-117]